MYSMIQIRSLIIAQLYAVRGTPGYLSPSLPLHFRAFLYGRLLPHLTLFGCPLDPASQVTVNGDAQGPSHCPSRRRWLRAAPQGIPRSVPPLS